MTVSHRGVSSGADNDSLGSLTPTKGNIAVGNGSAWVALGVGTNTHVLTADSAQTLGVKWAAAGSLSNVVEDTTPQLGGALDVNGFAITSASNGNIQVTPNGTGNVLIGATASRATFFNSTFAPKLQLEGTSLSTSMISAVINTNDTSSSYLILGKTRGTTVGGTTAVSSGDTVGTVSFQGSDGTELVPCASIYAMIDTGSGANDMPGRLVFATTIDGDTTPGEVMRMDSARRIIVGGASSRSTFFNTSWAPRFQTEGTSAAASTHSIVANTNDSAGSYLVLGKTRGTTVGSTTIVQNGDAVGNLNFQGSDGTDMVTVAAIYAAVEGTPGANDMPGRLVFQTTADGASSPSEAMRIDSNRLVSIGGGAANLSGALSTSHSILTLRGKTGTFSSIIELANNGTDTNDQLLGRISFYDAGTENARINSARSTSTDSGYITFHTRAAGGAITEAMRIYDSRGVTIGSPTGGDKGAGTLNASAVYDDNTLLTCYVPEAWLDGGLDFNYWDGPEVVPATVEKAPTDPETGLPIGDDVITPRQHIGAHKFAERLGTDTDPLDIEKYASHFRTQRHLTSFPNKANWVAGAKSAGSWVQCLVEQDEIQAVHIIEMHERLKALEEAFAAYVAAHP